MEARVSDILTRGEFESQICGLPGDTRSSTVSKLMRHDAAQRARIAELEAALRRLLDENCGVDAKECFEHSHKAARRALGEGEA